MGRRLILVFRRSCDNNKLFDTLTAKAADIRKLLGHDTYYLILRLFEEGIFVPIVLFLIILKPKILEGSFLTLFSTASDMSKRSIITALQRETHSNLK